MNINKAALTGLTLLIGVFVTGNLNVALGQWPPTVTDPQALNSNAASDDDSDMRPQPATDGRGTWVVVWESTDDVGGTLGNDYDVLFSKSTDNGATWSDSLPLNTNAAFDSGGDRYPQIAADGLGNWVVVWQSTDDLDGTIGTDADILFARSTNNGATWTAPLPLNANAYLDGPDVDHLWPVVATDGLGNWVAAWGSQYDLGGDIGEDSDVLFSRSTDNGATWTAPLPLNTTAYSDTTEIGDGMPYLAADGEGTWVAAWGSRNQLDPPIAWDHDILFSRSTDHGQTWSAPACLNASACYGDDGTDWSPGLATDGRGNWVAVWGTDNQVYGGDGDILYARSADNGETWTSALPLYTYADSDSGAEWDCRVTTDAQGNWVAVWDSKDDFGETIGPDQDIIFSLSTDNGVTWTDPRPLNTNAPSDTGDDRLAQVTTDGHGNWVVVWDSFEDLGGLGVDTDILVAQFNMNPIPTVSSWSLFGMTVLLVVAGALVLKKRLARKA